MRARVAESRSRCGRTRMYKRSVCYSIRGKIVFNRRASHSARSSRDQEKLRVLIICRLQHVERDAGVSLRPRVRALSDVMHTVMKNRMKNYYGREKKTRPRSRRKYCPKLRVYVLTGKAFLNYSAVNHAGVWPRPEGE